MASALKSKEGCAYLRDEKEASVIALKSQWPLTLSNEAYECPQFCPIRWEVGRGTCRDARVAVLASASSRPRPRGATAA